MNEIHYDVIIDQYKIILKSVIIFYFFIQQKFAKIFLELFSKYVDDQNYCNQVFSCNKEKNNLFSFSKKVTYNSWYEIYLQSCKKQRGQDLPNLAFNYCFEKAKCLYIKMKKLSKEKNIKFMNIARTIYKEFIQIEESNKKSNFLQKADFTPREERISLRNYLKQKTNKTLIQTSSFNLNITNPYNKLKSKILNESEEEKKEEKEKQKSNYINKINKLNIFVGEYDYLINNINVEKTKIYDGNLCATYILKKENEKIVNDKVQSILRKEKVKGLLNEGMAIFIANDSNVSANKENSSFRMPYVKFSTKSRLYSGNFMNKKSDSIFKKNSKFSLRKNILNEDKKFKILPSNINSNTNSKYSTLIIPKIDERSIDNSNQIRGNVPLMMLNNKKKEFMNRNSSLIIRQSIKKLGNFNDEYIDIIENKQGSSEIKSYMNNCIRNSQSDTKSIFKEKKVFNISNPIDNNCNPKRNKNPIMAKLLIEHHKDV